LAFGYDESWRILTSAASGEGEERRAAFFEKMDWGLLAEVTELALGSSVERIEAMLCLTAFHDVMKVTPLIPSVTEEHAPYNGFSAGDAIHDHDLALAYVLEYYPHLIPSFAMLPEALRDVVLFTQTKMSFNHGWFVQAEATPGAMLSSLKQVLSGASGADLSFYFFHWLTDISGAEGRPLAGAEKLTVKFPLAVLVSFLWSIPYLNRLAEHSETDVLENYLEARFHQSFPDEPTPEGETAIATMRLAVMAQAGASRVVEAFEQSSSSVRSILGEEMALTGIEGQSFLRSQFRGGPAFLVYYGPALLQRCGSASEMRRALTALAAVYLAGRQLWPMEEARWGETATLEISGLKALDIGDAIGGSAAGEPRVWVLSRQNEREARLELLSAIDINDLVGAGAAFVCVDLTRSGTPPATPEGSQYGEAVMASQTKGVSSRSASSRRGADKSRVLRAL